MSFLQPVTQNLPAIVREPIIALIGQECFTTLIYNTDFTSEHCLRLTLSKGLGLAIVLGGSIVKVPQIIKIVSGKSARGLSLASYVLDTSALGITVAYNIRNGFPWSTYGENVFLLVQNVIITFLIITFSSSASRSPLLLAFSVIFLLSASALSSSSLSPSTLQLLAASTIPLSLASKVPQILSNFRNASTGQLSAFLVFNSLAGCLARVYTTSTETKDPVLWLGFFLGAVLNGVLAAQMAAYWNNNTITTPSQKRKEELDDVVGAERTPKKAALKEKRAVVGDVPSTPVVAASPKVEQLASAGKSGGSRPSSPLAGRKYVRKLD